MKARNYETILTQEQGGVATITLNIPDRNNPLGPLMVKELLYALSDAHDADRVRAVVLTGAGGTFSAGADLKQLSAPDDSALPPKGDFADLLRALADFDKPTLAKVRGYALGGGLGLVASCHLAIGAEGATLGTPEIRRGLFPMMIMAALARLVPRRQLLHMMLVGEKLGAADAQRIGLLTRVVPDSDLDREVDALARKLAAQSPTAMAMGLRALRCHADQPLEEALPLLRDRLYELLATEDAREGLLAFAEKREPNWK